jgi:hypothetical protein
VRIILEVKSLGRISLISSEQLSGLWMSSLKRGSSPGWSIRTGQKGQIDQGLVGRQGTYHGGLGGLQAQSSGPGCSSHL